MKSSTREFSSVSISRAALSLAACLAVSCASAIPPPTTGDVERVRSRWSDLTLEDLKQGRDLYVAKCAGCHPLKDPSELAPSAWPSAVDDMVDEAHLSSDERDAIVRYLVTMSGR